MTFSQRWANQWLMSGSMLFQVSIIDYIFFNLYLFKMFSKLTFSFLFGDLSNIDLFFTFLSINSNPVYIKVISFCLVIIGDTV